MKYFNTSSINLKFLVPQDNASESVRVGWQLVQGFLIGTYLAAFNVGATSLFLDHFDETTQMPIAIVASGVVGIILTYIFTFLQARISFILLSIMTVFLITATTSFFLIDLRFTSDTDTVIFFAFVCMTPFNSLLLLVFWGLFSTLFSLRESKRIIGRIDTGQQVASIVALIGIPLSLPLLGSNNANLFAISAVSGALLLVVLFILNKKYHLSRTSETVKEISERRTSVAKLFTNKYILMLSAFVIVSLIAISFVNYSFNIVTAEQYSGISLANFLSIFSAIMVIVGFLIQTFLTDKLLDTYGLKVALLINPILLLLFTVIAFLTGSFLGYEKESKAFIFFSLSIALSQLIVKSLKDALDSPSFKLYFLPLDKNIRLNAQSSVEGVVTAGASLIAGGLLWLINGVQIFSLIHFTFFLIPITVLWIFVAFKMYSQYKSTLETTLKNIKRKENEKKDEVIKEDQGDWQQNNQFGAVYDILVVEKLDALLAKAEMMDSTRNRSAEMKDYALNRNTEDIYQPSADRSQRHLALRKKVVSATQVQDDKEFTNINIGRLDRFARSKVKNERVYAAKMLSKALNDTNIDILLSLIRDKDDDVKSAAIHTARKAQRSETWNLLIFELNSYIHRNEAIAALIEAGEDVLDTLEVNFHRANQSKEVQLIIIQIYGRIGGVKVIDLLWRKIDYPDKNVVEQVLFALSYCKFTAKGVKARIISSLLENEIGNASWNQAAITEVADTPYLLPLRGALDEEITYNFDRIFRLLALLYDPESIALVRENVESDTSEGKVYAIELMDVFISKNLKPMLFPLLDDITPSERINLLQSYFPRKKYDSIEVLEQIISSDYNHINRWTKACALYALAHTVQAPVNNNLMAHLFNPDELLCETAAYAVRRKDKSAYQRVSARLNEKVRRKLDKIFEPISFEKNKEDREEKISLTIDKTLFLKEIKDFSSIQGIILAEVSEALKPLYFKSGETVQIQNESNNALYIVAKGDLMLLDKQESVYLVKEKEIFGEILTSDTNKIEYITATHDALVYAIDKEYIHDLVAKYQQFAGEFSKIVKNRSLAYYIYEN